MPEDKNKKMDYTNKGINTEVNKSNPDLDLTNTESDSVWVSPSKLKEEVQTIIDIMGPALSPKFSNYNTSSEADNEESIFSNSKFSSLVKYKPKCDCNQDESEKTDAPDISKDELNISAAADNNTTTGSTAMDDTITFHYEQPQCYGAPQYICPPPLIPANMCVNSECMCPQVANILHGGGLGMTPSYGYRRQTDVDGLPTSGPKDIISPNVSKTCKDSKNIVLNWLKTIVSAHRPLERENNTCEYYKMNVKRKRNDEKSPPRRVVFQLVEGIPSYEKCHDNLEYQSLKSKDTKNLNNELRQGLQNNVDLQHIPIKENNCGKQCIEKRDLISEKDCPRLKKPLEKTTYYDSSGKTKVDVYYFDHGTSSHYRTTDAPPLAATEEICEKTEKHATRFWAEIFGTLHIGFSFVTSFILQFFRFLLYSLLRPLTIGLIQLASDYFFKPLLATTFNGIIQPILIFVFNIAASLRDLCDPIAEGVGYFLRECAALVRAFRLVEINNEKCKCVEIDCKCERKRCIKNIYV